MYSKSLKDHKNGGGGGKGGNDGSGEKMKYEGTLKEIIQAITCTQE